jgi:hypothetical protein
MRHNLFLSVALSAGLSAFTLNIAAPATAVQFKRLVSTGQVVPGSKNPVLQIGEPTIASDAQVALLLSKEGQVPDTCPSQPVPCNPDRLPPVTARYDGIYRITSSGQLQLIKEVVNPLNRRSTQGFTAPSISGGRIAYGTKQVTGGRPNGEFTYGSIEVADQSNKTSAIASFYLLLSDASSRGDYVKLTNNQVLVENDRQYFDIHDDQDQRITGLLSIDTAMKRKTIADFSPVGASNVRVGANLIAATVGGELREGSTINSLRRVIVPVQGAQAGNCGYAVSYSNLVSCANVTQNGKTTAILSVRLSATGQFTRIRFANDATAQISAPSISKGKVVFRTIESGVEKIRLSLNGQSANTLISAGAQLNGKVVKGLQLSNNGRAIAGNHVVFTATFTDGSSSLYRADL